ncbi:MAG: hypothetical protein SGPRY_009544, partial [Prymnesium sp.]
RIDHLIPVIFSIAMPRLKGSLPSSLEMLLYNVLASSIVYNAHLTMQVNSPPISV